MLMLTMQSALTRSVFRRILRNESIMHPDCIYRHARPLAHHAKCSHVLVTRRTLFGFRTLLPKSPVKKEGKDPGLRAMAEASRKKELRIRMPPAADLAAAWKVYFEDKFERKESIRDSHARHALNAFEYIQSVQKLEDSPLITSDDMMTALVVLANRATQVQDDSKLPKLNPCYVKLADELLNNLRSHTSDEDIREEASEHYVRILTFSGNAQRARDFLSTDDGAKLLSDRSTWRRIIVGFLGERNADALRAVERDLERDRASLLPQLPQLAPILTSAFAVLDQMGDAKRVYSKVTSTQYEKFYMTVITAALRNNENEWGKSIIQQMMNDADIIKQRRHWDAIFVWAAGTGKSVDGVDRMMQVMVRRNPDFKPDTTTMNNLIAYAITKNDAYMAERFLALGAKWGAEPDVFTYLYQMDYRLSNGDIDGAISAYRSLQDFELPGQEDLPRINRLVRSMCVSGKHSFDAIMDITKVLNDRRAPFEADTTAALSVLHLKHDADCHDVVNLLLNEAPSYDTVERIRIRDALVNFCLDRRNSIARVWDTYIIFHQVFDTDSARDVRTTVMNEFLKRRRCDMAVYVFNHMREHRRDDTRATLDTYVDVLVGIGRLADDESLEVVHNQLKLDMHIEPNTRLHNARMLAFLGCDMPRTAFGFWKEVVTSAEGPTYNSLLIIMRVCEKMPFGEEQAKQIWEQLRTLDVEVTPGLLAAYVGALAGNDLFEEAKLVCLEAEKDYGVVPDTFILGTLYSASRHPMAQYSIEWWIKTFFAEQWQELDKIGFRTQRDGTSVVRINRNLEP